MQAESACRNVALGSSHNFHRTMIIYFVLVSGSKVIRKILGHIKKTKTFWLFKLHLLESKKNKDHVFNSCIDGKNKTNYTKYFFEILFYKNKKNVYKNL